MDYRRDLVKILELDQLNLPKVPKDPYFNFSPRTSLIELLNPNKSYQPIPPSLKSHNVRALESIKPGPIPGFNANKLEMSFSITANSNIGMERDEKALSSGVVEEEFTAIKRKTTVVGTTTGGTGSVPGSGGSTGGTSAPASKKARTTTIVRTTKL